jgi:hypothetical protein
MKLRFAGLVTVVAICIAVLPCAAQTTTFTPPTDPPQVVRPTPQAAQPTGQVIISRSTDENGQTTTHTGSAAASPAIQMAAAPSAEDAERQAVTYTDFDMDVRLRTAEQHIAVRALVTVRNDGKTPLGRIPLQLSSSLNWERIRVNGNDTAFQVATLNSDADHTGQLHEAAIPLGQPLAPGASLQLDVTYSGAIAPSAQRLLAIGTPDDVALHSDWDRIGVSFTGLRGFGNVVWYPVSSVPVILGDGPASGCGSRSSSRMGRRRRWLSSMAIRLRWPLQMPATWARKLQAWPRPTRARQPWDLKLPACLWPFVPPTPPQT